MLLVLALYGNKKWEESSKMNELCELRLSHNFERVDFLTQLSVTEENVPIYIRKLERILIRKIINWVEVLAEFFSGLRGLTASKLDTEGVINRKKRGVHGVLPEK